MNQKIHFIAVFLATFLATFFGSTVFAQPSNPCIPVGEDACENAPILNLCQLDGWMSDTDPDYVNYTPGSTIPTIGWCNGMWSIENNQWLGFVAETEMVILGVDISDCNASAGIQIAAYETGQGGPCVGSQLSCIGFASGENSSFNYNIWGLTIGEVYLIMIDGFGGDGCPFTFNVVQGADNPIEAVANPLPVCPGIPSFTALNAIGSSPPPGPGVTYLWETDDGNIVSGETTLFPVIDQPGTYTLTIIDNNTCCLNTQTVIVPAQTEFPDAVANVDGAITCDNTEVTLDATGSSGTPTDPNFFYQWYDPNGNDIALAYELEGITEPGTYELVVLDLSTGCLSEPAQVEVPFDTISPVIAPTSDGILNCIDSELTIEGNGSSGVFYQWEGPSSFTSNAASPFITIGGEYTVTVTDQDNGCTNSAMIEIPVDTLAPDVSAIGAEISCSVPTVQIEAASADAGVNFEWSGSTFSGLGNQVTVSEAEEYVVVATGVNGCTATATAEVTADTAPPAATADVNDILNCTTTSVIIDGGTDVSNASFEWVGADGTSYAVEDPSVSTATSYTLVVTNLDNGCTESASVTVTEDVTLPDNTTSVDDVLDCVTPQVGLQGNTSVTNPTYSWSGPNGFSANTSNPSAENVGTYTLTITGENGCTSTSTVDVTEDITPPMANAGPDGIITCEDTQTIIDGSGSSSGAEYTYEWQNNGGTTISNDVTTQVNNAETYTLIVTNTTNGCTSSDDVLINADANLPTADAGVNQTITCLQDEVILDGSASSSSTTIDYLWLDAGGGILGTDINIPTSNPGIYTLVVNDTSNGCESQSQVEVLDNTANPNAQIATPNTITCTDPEIQVDGAASTGTGGIQYEWTDSDGNFVSNMATFQTSTAGTYDLVVTNDDNGCTDSNQITVLEDTVVPSADAGAPSTITCVQSTVPLDGSASAGANLVYEWTNSNGDIVSTDASTTTMDDGIYNLLITNSVNGCTDTDQVTIAIDADFPTVDPGTPTTLTCLTLDAPLDGSASFGGPNLEYEWQDPNGNTIATDAVTDVSAPGIYTLIVSNIDNDCVAQETIEIPQDIIAPDSDAGSDQVITCDVTEVMLDGTASSIGGGFSYEWTNDAGVVIGDATMLTVSSPGTYNLIVTDTNNGCTSSASAMVSPDENIPTAAANIDGILTCANLEVNVDNMGSSAGGNITYQWSDASDNTLGSGDNIAVSSPGVYNLLVTDTANGCTSETIVQVDQDIEAPQAEAGDADILTCSITSVELDGNASTGLGTLEFEWSNPSGVNIGNTANVDVGEAGLYTLMITDTQNGCTNSDVVEVVPDENLPTAIAGMPQTLTCAFTEAMLDGSASSAMGGGALAYEWFAPDGSSISNTFDTPITTPGVYTLEVTDDLNGCVSSAAVEIFQDILDPTPQITEPDILTCVVESVDLDGSASVGVDLAYEWQNANGVVVGNTSTISVNEAGIYNLFVTDNSNGCTATMQTEVFPDENLPTALAQVNDILTCIVEEVTLGNMGSSTGANFSYEWQSPSGAAISTDESVDVGSPGVYSLLVTDTNNGCTSETSIEVLLDNESPQSIINQNNPIISCDVDNVSLDGSASLPSGMIDFEWFNSGGVSVSNTQMPMVDEVDTYTLVVTNTVNGCTDESNIEVQQDVNVPVVNIPAPDVLTCFAPTIDLLSTGSSTGDFTYEWTDENGAILSNDVSIAVNDAGIYELTIINNINGCDNSNSVQVNVDQEPPVVQTNVEDILDCVTPSVFLSSAGSSVGSQYNYEWSGPSLLSSVSSENPEVNEAGDYALLITNTDNGCTENSITTVDENTAQPNAAIIGAADPSCFGLSDGIVQVDQIVGGTAPYMYSFNGEPFSSQVDYISLPSGSYSLEVEDATGCTWDTLLNLVDPVQIDVELGDDLVVQLGESVEIDALINIDADIITWEGTDSLSCQNCLTQDLTPTQSGPYSVTAYDENGCEDTDEIFLRVEIVRPIYVPNAFSPHDENGINDGFTVFSGGNIVKEILNLTVADRWGEIVFTKSNFQPNDPAEGWDGIFRGKQMDPQVFIWYAEIEFIDGVVILYKGDVTLVN